MDPEIKNEPGHESLGGIDTDEASRIYEAHSRYIYYLALRILGDESLAEDATHEVFIKVFRHLGGFRAESNLRTWLYRITINHCQNQLRRWQNRNVLSNSDDPLWDTAASNEASPLRVLELKELGQRIQTTLQTLPQEYRLLLLLASDEHLSYDEMAAITEQTSDAVRGKLHRARKAFAAQFQKTA